MALVAIGAVVDVSFDALVFIVRVGLGMAAGALEHTVVGRIRVAGSADSVRAAVIHRESRCD